MADHSEMIKDARELGMRVDMAIVRGELDGHFELFESIATMLRKLGHAVEAHDKEPTLAENLAAFRRDLDALDRRVGQQAMMNTCVLCGNDNARAWEWLKRGPPGELSSSCTRMVCSHCVTVMKLGRPPIHPAAGGRET